MRALRADNMKLTEDNTRLKEKHAETQRKLHITESAEASLKTQLKSADAVAKGLKEDVARHKAAVAQARSSCSTDVRRRDLQIEALKKQLAEAGRARGTRGNPAVTTISVTGDFGAEGTRTSARKGGAAAAAAAPGDEGYTLRSETNAFLAKLAGELSEENEAIVGTMRNTVERLRQMSGWTGDSDGSEKADPQVVKKAGWEVLASDVESVLDHMKLILTNPSFVPIEEVMVREEEITRLKTGWVKMEERWTEAVHLMEGWRQRMAANGRPIDDEELKMGLRLSPVRVKSIRETAQAQIFDLSAVAEEEEEEEEEMEVEEPDLRMETDNLVVPANPTQRSPCVSRKESLELVPAPETTREHYKEQPQDVGRYDEDGFYEDPEEEDNWQREGETDAEEEPNVEILATSAGPWEDSRDSSPLPEPPQLSPLRQSPSAGNRRLANNNSSKKARPGPGDFSTIAEENSWAPTDNDEPPPPPPHRIKPSPSRQVKLRSPARTSLEEALLPPEEDYDMGHESDVPIKVPSPPVDDEEDELAAPAPRIETPRRAASKLPLPRNPEPAPQQSPLTMATIAAKLAASEREADAARVRAKLKAARGTRGVKRPAPANPAPEPKAKAASPRANQEDVDPVKRDPLRAQDEGQEIKVEKRKRERRTSKVASRRRSTLSPWELESLMTGNV